MKPSSSCLELMAAEKTIAKQSDKMMQRTLKFILLLTMLTLLTSLTLLMLLLPLSVVMLNAIFVGVVDVDSDSVVVNSVYVVAADADAVAVEMSIADPNFLSFFTYLNGR